MLHPKPQPIESIDHLRERVSTLLGERGQQGDAEKQMALDMPPDTIHVYPTYSPRRSVKGFLDFITDAMPDGDVYLFGGILRDIALFGRRGFNSDIDLVVDGDWWNCRKYIETLGGKKNKFGGYRIQIGSWPIDIWNAKETWAISNGFVSYNGIASLTKTTVLNWDAILMNWRTKAFIHDDRYLDQLIGRKLDVILFHNPDPLGMMVRVLRHLVLKHAEKIAPSAAQYLVDASKTFTYAEVHGREEKSYGRTVINPYIYQLFSQLLKYDELDIRDGYAIVSALVSIQRELRLQ